MHVLNTLKSSKNNTSQGGFTLIELLIYIALTSLIMSSITLLGLNLVLAQQQSDVQLTVAANIQNIAQRVQYEVRNAQSIVSASANDICLISSVPNRSPVRIYRTNNTARIAWGGGGSDCSSLSFDEQFSDSSVAVSSFDFSDFSQANSEHVFFSVTVEYDGGRAEWQRTESYAGSVELRSAN
ncbi:prepilin-type N-terminal cleavage/methylation domain-containing protein [Candidatus Woesebacteria bacterium]|nr:prepilin-type N-terminal cleavage/methylation domain-containing protein [Candidatus Woesebacteria bacterium]MCD8507497.1 prepilin-type N-terminal cleavage/methylation domain-containing protein [Candidatus Woesebacteria bacterium]MCD8526952.1 prepilin-type N-terminal cleavage/methylation domain-containing protein [Candidatus Woesebacteria bacterium]MCD8545851.1 prepilin-type N-terminal cleavage/methylation domain-containing protein [Candidatus Woesebacteria bacterium]